MMHERNQDNFFPTFIKLFVYVLSNQSFESNNLLQKAFKCIPFYHFGGFYTFLFSDTKIFFVISTLYFMTIKHHIHLASDLCTNRYSSDGKMMFNSKLEDGKSF